MSSHVPEHNLHQAWTRGVNPELPPLPGQPGLDEDEPEINVMEYLALVWSRRWVVAAIVLMTTVLGGAWAVTRPARYRATAEISVGEQTPQIIRNQLNMGPSWWERERYVDEHVRVLKSRFMAQRVVERLGLDVNPELAGSNPIGTLRGMLEAERIADTSMIKLTMTAQDSVQVAEWLNVYVDVYVDTTIYENIERARKVFDVIQSRLDPLREDLAKAEQELMRFKEREDAILFADQDKNVITEQVNTLTSEYAQTKTERIRLETKINTLRRIAPSTLTEVTFPEIMDDPTIQSLVTERSSLELELSEKLSTYREGHPVIKDLRTRLAGVETRIAEQVEAVKRSLQTKYTIVRTRETSLFDNIQQLKQQSIELSKQTMEFERLKREYDQNKLFLEEMLTRSKEVDISSTAAVNNVKIIEPAIIPSEPFTPNVRRALTMSMVLGLFLGVGLVLGLDFLDQSLRTPEQVERYLGLEALTTIPSFANKKSREMVEAFQTLRTALMLAARGEGAQVLQITSSIPGEGKTTIALNLGKTLAKAGARVLLLDSDLRKPRLHRMVGTSNASGLTSVVLGECELRQVIRRIEEAPKLDMVTSGPLPSNPPELYGKASFKRVLDNARQSYDWILIDTPPVGSVTDPVICAQLTDMVLLVVEYSKTRRQMAKGTIRLLARAGVRLAGVVLNKVDLERDHYYYSTYHYSGYSYGSEDTSQR